MKNPITEKALQILNNHKDRSAWSRGVNAFAVDLLCELDESIADGWTAPDVLRSADAVETALLNGAKDWKQYAWGGSGLVYDGDIARALCTPSELRRTHNGERRPNCREEWLDVYARAMWQAARRVRIAIKVANHREEQKLQGGM